MGAAMKCAQHNSLDAVGTCNLCNKGLCPECVSTFTTPLCESCAISNNKQVARSLWLQLGLMIGLLGFSFMGFIDSMPFFPALVCSLLVAFFPSGWRFLSRHFPSSSSGSLMMNCISLMFHAMAALFAGVIVGPIQLFKAYKEFALIRSAKQVVLSKESGEA